MKKIYSLFAIAMVANLAVSQDVHFSQFYASPLTLNPANAGINACDYRAGLNYRTQWKSVTVPYKTFGLWGDINVLEDKILMGDQVGLGASLVSDRAGDGELTTNKISLAGAYHKSLTGDKAWVLSVALGGAYVQKKIDFTKLYWDDQWNGEFFDEDGPTSELPATEDLSYFDLQVGLRVTYTMSDNMQFYIGASMFHVNSARESFIASGNKLGKRPVIHGGGNVVLQPGLFLEPAFLYMRQKKAYEAVVGSLVGYVNPNWNGVTVLGGAWYRFGDAAIVTLGGQYESFRLLMNYDFNLSQLTPATNVRGGFELSLIYVGCIPTYTPPSVIPCPRM
jgi:type IX secretion system PorP/SprF family membrane protein